MSTEYPGFRTTQSLPIEELNVKLVELVHEKTGAKIMHIDADDDENVFCISFQTLPDSSNGVAHILEHTVLCGSKNYGVKDPFFSMTRRSLNTFMNAFTGSDFTCYPASSQVKQDFYNLLDVYIDSVFYPKLSKLSFLQEGHRLEYVKDHLEFKGVVFNEMKGAMATPDSRFFQALMEALTPDLTYAVNSGGEPADIVKLTYDELIDFHRYYYHPAHALFYFYGNIDLKEHLEFLEKKVLNNAHFNDPIKPISLQKRFSAPKRLEKPYPFLGDHPEKSHIVGFGFLTTPIADQEKILALALLDSLLMETDASPLHQKLIESGLTQSVEAYLDTEMSEIPWIISCKGCSKDSADKLEEILFEALKSIAKKKFTKEEIDAAIHQLEFHRLEISGSHYPYGLNLFMRAALLKQHGMDPQHGLLIHSLFKKLRNQTKDPEYLSTLIYEMLIDNPHFVRLEMLPDTKLLENEEAKEKDELKKIEETLSDHDKKILIDQAEKLKAHQEKEEKEEVKKLPCIKLEDIPKKGKDIPLEVEGSVYFSPVFTNHVIHADWVFPLPDISEKELPYLSLFTSILTDVGAGKRNWEENLHYMNQHIGRIQGQIIITSPLGSDEVFPALNIKSAALFRKREELFGFVQDLMTTLDFSDKNRMIDLLKRQKTYLVSRLSKNAMRYAYYAALANTTKLAYLQNIFYGYPYFEMIDELSKDYEKGAEKLIQLFTSWQSFLQTPFDLLLSCEKSEYDALKKENFYGHFEQKRKLGSYFKSNFKQEKILSHARPISSNVAFTAMGLPTIDYEHEDAPALLIASQLMQNTFLHREIREIGGAYGSGANYTPTRSSFTFNAYRDPHLKRSVEKFREAVEHLKKNTFDENELFEAKIGIIQDLDAPIDPKNKAISAYFWKKNALSFEKREAFRKKILEASARDIVKSLEHLNFDDATLISFAEEKFFSGENSGVLDMIK